MVSVVCPIYNEEKYIETCIKAITLQDYPKDDLEVLLIDGMSTDRTRDIIQEAAKVYTYIKLIDNPQKIVPCAMNIGIEQAKGDIIVRLDAHAKYPDTYISNLVRHLNNIEGADNVGGICKTMPCNKSAKAIAIATALSSVFGMGNSHFRIGCKKIMSVDTVPFGCFRKSLFDKIGLYDEELIRNQDDELNGRIIKNGGKIYLIPDIEIKYYARDKISKIRKMYYQYGLFKPLVNKKLGFPATARQFFPSAFILGIIIGGILSTIFAPFAWCYFCVLSLYLAIGLYIGATKAMTEKKLSLFFIMPYIFLNIHLSYGFGYFKGIYKVMTKKKFNAKSNR